MAAAGDGTAGEVMVEVGAGGDAAADETPDITGSTSDSSLKSRETTCLLSDGGDTRAELKSITPACWW